MKKELKELIQTLTQGEREGKVLDEKVEEKGRKVLKQLSKEVALVLGRVYCEGAEGVGDGFYSRDTEGLFGKKDFCFINRILAFPVYVLRCNLMPSAV